MVAASGIGHGLPLHRDRCAPGPKSSDATMGIDIGRNSFHVVELDRHGPLSCGRNGPAPCRSAARQPAALPERHSLDRAYRPNRWRRERSRASIEQFARSLRSRAITLLTRQSPWTTQA